LVNKEIPLSAIRPSPKHWGRTITPQDVEELADNIDKIGQLHQITVRPAGKSKRMYELLAGERRYHALRRLGRKTARCLVVGVDDDRAGFLSISENLCQKPMTGKEIAEAGKALEEYYIRLFSKADSAQAARDKEDQKQRAQNILKGPPRRSRVKAKTEARKAAAKDLGVSARTLERAAKRMDNLTAAAARMYEIDRISDTQADILATLPAKEQKIELARMLSESAADTRRRITSAKPPRRRGPIDLPPPGRDDSTETMGHMLEEIIKSCTGLKKILEACLSYADGRDIDYDKLRKQPIDRMEACSALLGELVAIIE